MVSYHWTLEQPLPTLPIPLKKGDDDVPLNLQDALDTVYDRAGYDLSVNYRAELDPPPAPNVSEWIRTRLQSNS